MRVEFSRFVEGDLEAIADYIAEDNPVRAVTFIGEIRNKVSAIGRQPMLYRLRPEIGPDARMAVMGRYVLLFRILNNCVRIERVVFGGRDLASLFEE